MPDTKDRNNEIIRLPMLALRGLNVFPGMVITFDVERPASVAALTAAAGGSRSIFLAAQKNLAEDAPDADGIYKIGTVCRVCQQLRQAKSGVCRVMVEGLYRAEALSISPDPKGYSAAVRRLPDKNERVSSERMEALVRSCLSLYEEYLNLNPDIPPEQILSILANPSPAKVASHIAHNVRFTLEQRQSLLENRYPSRRLEQLNKYLTKEINVLGIEKEISEAAQAHMDRAQREYYLREEIKAIQEELGEDAEDTEVYRLKIAALEAPQEVKEKLMKELGRLTKQPFGSSEAAVLRNYLDVCLELPWGQYTKETLDIAKARKLLDKEHFGLDKVKERVLEYLAVRKLSPEVKGGLLCLVGPPGTGKTSVAMSIARATNRKSVRISLGGVHDEAEIRGHRKTYIGSMPGRIIQGIIQAGSCNPLMILDEVDKLGSDYRGDPSAALLEALDGEQNGSFRDNFLELPFDLSNVFFVTTANSLDTIPRPLLDRMEVIELSSYTDEEKLQIAKRHLLPKQRRKHGLGAAQLKVGDAAIREIIRAYTRESGVRQLERELAAVCRKAAGGIAEEKYASLTVKPGQLEPLLGAARFKPEQLRVKNEIGLVRGLAYTAAGGEALDVEASVVEGSGKLELTGNLGDVMKESVRAAVTYIRSKASVFGVDPDFYKNRDIHIHFPEGAVPKDGPSAGVTVCVALVSALTGTPVKSTVAMTGEITLRGRVLPIGGLREKTMAALRAGVHTVIIPMDNLPDLEEIDQTVRQRLRFVPVDRVDGALAAALEGESAERCPSPISVKSHRSGVRQ